MLSSCQVKGYRVYYTMEPSRPMNEWQIHNVQDSVITTIQNLVTSETYTIQVLAFTSVGDGPFSDPVHVKVMPGGQWVCDGPCVSPHNPRSSTAVFIYSCAGQSEFLDVSAQN